LHDIVVLVVEVVLVELVLVEPVLVVLVEDASPGGPEWQWFLSPWPQPGLHGLVVPVVDEVPLAPLA
jgi:hypothetical protein